MKRTSVAGPSISIPGGRKAKRPQESEDWHAPWQSQNGRLVDAAQLLRLLGDPTRLRLLLLLRRVGPLPVFELATRLEMQASAVSHALRLLRARDVVRSRREGKMMVYFLCSGDVEAILDRFVP